MFTIAFCKHLAVLKFKTLNHKYSVIRWTNNKKNVTPVKGPNVGVWIKCRPGLADWRTRTGGLADWRTRGLADSLIEK